jgi:hypothetical protein
MDQPKPLQLLGGATLAAPVTVLWDGPTTSVKGTASSFRTPATSILAALVDDTN